MDRDEKCLWHYWRRTVRMQGARELWSVFKFMPFDSGETRLLFVWGFCAPLLLVEAGWEELTGCFVACKVWWWVIFCTCIWLLTDLPCCCTSIHLLQYVAEDYESGTALMVQIGRSHHDCSSWARYSRKSTVLIHVHSFRTSYAGGGGMGREYDVDVVTSL